MDNQETAKKRVHVRYEEIPAKRPRKRNWKPIPNRTPFLSSIILILALCVISLEILIRKAVPFTDEISKDNLPTKRQVASTNTAVSSAAHPSSTAYVNVDSSTTAARAASTAPTVTYVKTTSEDDYINADDSTTTTLRVPQATTTVSNAYIGVDTSTATTQQAPLTTTTTSNAYINVDSSSSNPATTPTTTPTYVTTTPDAYISPDESTTTIQSTTDAPQHCVYITVTAYAVETVWLSKRGAPTPYIEYVQPKIESEPQPYVHDLARGVKRAAQAGTTGCTTYLTISIASTAYLYLDNSVNTTPTPTPTPSPLPTSNAPAYSTTQTSDSYINIDSSSTVSPTTTSVLPISPGSYINIDSSTIPPISPSTSGTTMGYGSSLSPSESLTSSVTPGSYINVDSSTTVSPTTTSVLPISLSSYLNIDSSTPPPGSPSTSGTTMGYGSSLSPSEGLTSSAIPGSYISIDSSTTVSPTTTSVLPMSPSSYLNIDSSTPPPGSPSTSGTTMGYGSTLSPSNDLTSSAIPGSYINIDSSSTKSASISGSSHGTESLITVTSGSYINIDSASATSSTTSSGGFLVVGHSTASDSAGTALGLSTQISGHPSGSTAVLSSYKVVGSSTSVAFINIGSSAGISSLASQLSMSQFDVVSSSTSTSTVRFVGSHSPVQTPDPLLSTGSSYSGSTSLSNPSATLQSQSGSNVVTSTGDQAEPSGQQYRTRTQGSSSTASTSPAPSQTGFVDTITGLVRDDYQIELTFTKTKYYTIMYLPSIVAIIIQELWFLIATNLKMMEPFRLLNQPEGATVKESLMTDYLSAPTSLHTFGSALRGNALMACILFINMLMPILAPLATGSMTVIATGMMINADGSKHRNKPKWIFSMVVVRILQGALSLIMIVVVVIMGVGWRRRSGISANPSRTATMAALLNHPAMVQDLRSIDPNASEREIEQVLAHNRYMITNYEDSEGNNRCGVVKVGEQVPEGIHSLPSEDLGVPQTRPKSWLTRMDHQNISQSTFDVCFVVFTLGLLGVIVAYWKDGSNSGFNNFFNSARFGPRFILSLSASITTMAFQNIEREVRLMTPYRLLAKRKAPSKDTVLRSVNGTALTSVGRSTRHGNWFHLFITLVTLLGDLLIITAAGIPFNPAETYIMFRVSFFISVAVLSLMILALLAVFVWRRQNKRANIPQKPNETLVRVWMTVSNKDNRLRKMLDDMGDKSNRDIRLRFKRTVGLYWGGWIKDEHNREMWCIDKEYYHDPAGYY